MSMSRQIAGEEIKERVFRASRSAYATLIGMFGGLVCFGLIFAVFVHPSFWTAVAIFLVPLALSSAWLKYFRVVLSEESLTYRTLLADPVMIEWRDIGTAELKIGYLRNEPGGLFRPPFRLVLKPKSSTTPSIIINVKLLSRSDLSDLLKTVESMVDGCEFPKKAFW